MWSLAGYLCSQSLLSLPFLHLFCRWSKAEIVSCWLLWMFIELEMSFHPSHNTHSKKHFCRHSSLPLLLKCSRHSHYVIKKGSWSHFHRSIFTFGNVALKFGDVTTKLLRTSTTQLHSITIGTLMLTIG